MGGGAPAITSKVLPPLPGMSNVNVIAGDRRVTVTFDPVDNAKDYRIYSLPADGDVLVDAASGKLSGVKNAAYRCAGTHEAADIAKDASLDPHYNNCEEFAIVDSSKAYVAHCGTGNDCFPTAGGTGNHFGQGGYARQPSEVQLGYVYTTPGPGRVAVHALGDSNRAAYYECGRHGWVASRTKNIRSTPPRRTSCDRRDGSISACSSTVPMRPMRRRSRSIRRALRPARPAPRRPTTFRRERARLPKKAAQTIATAFPMLKGSSGT